MSDWVINPLNINTVNEFVTFFKQHLLKNEPFKVTIKKHDTRTLSQNALFHVWVRQYASVMVGVPVSEVTKIQETAMKLTIKRACYAQTHWDFLLHTPADYFGQIEKPQPTSSKDWSPSEAYQVMEWLQVFAAERDSLMLEAKGEFKKLREDSLV